MAQLNHRLFQKAKRCLVAGVNSPVRSFGYVGGEPLLIKRGRGSKVYDHDGRCYIDYVLSWGALILGHAPAGVVDAVRQAAASGMSFGTTHWSEVELAQAIQKAIPFVEKIRFVNSGTEAVMGAVRLARGSTGRDKILKFEHAYHGHADYLLTKAGSGLATLGIPASAGVPRDFLKHTLVIPYGDSVLLEKVFQKYGRRLAAVLVEPAGGNYGVIPPDRGFLGRLRTLTKRHGALLIFDEVITGFRFRFGTLAQELGMEPDLVCLGKIIGGGLPIGAYGGREGIMRSLSPAGPVYQASTFAGNPVVMASGLATLKALERSQDGYKRIQGYAERLALGLQEEARAAGIDLAVVQWGPMFSLKFADKNKFAQFYRRMLERGVFLAPSEYEANFVSFSHSAGDIKKTLAAAHFSFRRIR